ncbi:MAG: polyprenyl synthetase family protein [Myxococcales bacterium]|nr:polyprenyl synthetase family protein [Myxococcales bacterium]
MRPPPIGSADFSAALSRLRVPLSLVDRTMRDQLGSASPMIGALGEHVLGSGGKRMRPTLLLLCAEMCGYTGPRRVDVAAAVELLHTATLLHDDVVDVSDLRRGQPSANSLWGNRRAVLGGDFLYARSCSLVVEDGDPDIIWLFAEAIRRLSEGELLQLERSFDPSVTEAHYFAVIEAKSAALLECACECGAILGGVTRAERRKLAEFGRELGLAFQLRDDALDYQAGADALGKRPLGDLREGKVTLPLLLTLKRCDVAERDAMEGYLKAVAEQAAAPGDTAEREIADVLRAVRRYRGIEDTVRRAEEHAARAATAIAAFPDSDAKRDLLAAAEFSVARDH